MSVKRRNVIIAVAVFIMIYVVIMLVGISFVTGKDDDFTADAIEESGGETLDELMTRVEYSVNDPVKAPIDISTVQGLYDELPEIDKYPLSVVGNGDVDIEIFTSGEKAGGGSDNWLVDVANTFNRGSYTLPDGKTVSISVRSIASGTGADYIISGKYLPDLYTPSNEIFGEYARQNGGSLELYEKRLVGNTAGFVVKNDSSYESLAAVLDVVISGSLNVGYTNPQSSASGANLLIELLKDFGDGAVDSDKAVDAFAKFNNNIPFVAYTTQQMIESAQNGSLDGFITEYQAYINNDTIKNNYKFIPFGIRHDNPLYLVGGGSKSQDELDAVKIITDYLRGSEAQELASTYGFNALDDYESSYELSGEDIIKAFDVYKTKKDAGRDIIAVFVADCSGSMDGEPLQELKSSLSNGMNYINENNYVGLVSYSGDVTIEVPIAKFDFTQKSYFQGALNNLIASGSTYSYEAVCVGLNMIREAKESNPNAKCMLFLLSDGYANGSLGLGDIAYAVKSEGVPVYTIGYTDEADMQALGRISGINEAASISADSDDIVYKIKSLFNAQL